MTADRSERLPFLDVLRGVGVLGILAVHIQGFATVRAARGNPTLLGDLHGTDWWAWVGTHALADGKFLAIFAMLFGAGIVLSSVQAENLGVPAARAHYRRMVLLLLIGLCHAYLLWYGDMLVPLAVCGTVVFGFRTRPARQLIPIGVGVLAVAPALVVGLAWSLLYRSADVAERVLHDWAPPASAISDEIAAYRGSWLDQMAHRVPAAFQAQTSEFGSFTFWQISGLMLIGMGLLKLGVFDGRRSVRSYAAVAAVGFGVGVPVILYSVAGNVALQWSLQYWMTWGFALDYAGNLLVGLGWIGLVMLLYRSGWQLSSIAAAGRMALTNYLLQTVVCTTLFYGHGLALFGRVDRVGQIAVVVGLWTLQVAVSRLWLRHFAFGPAEWASRCLVTGQRLPLRRAAPPTSVPATA